MNCDDDASDALVCTGEGDSLVVVEVVFIIDDSSVVVDVD